MEKTPKEEKFWQANRLIAFIATMLRSRTSSNVPGISTRVARLLCKKAENGKQGLVLANLHPDAGASAARCLLQTQVHAGYGAGQAGGFVGVDHNGIEAGVLFGHFEARGKAVEEAAHHGLLVHTDD